MLQNCVKSQKFDSKQSLLIQSLQPFDGIRLLPKFMVQNSSEGA